MKKLQKMMLAGLLSVAFLTGCGSKEVQEAASSVVIPEDSTEIVLSDGGITVNGATISEDANEAVFAGFEIIYYEEGKDATYGEGGEEDAHSKEEADKHTVVTITKPGTYTVSGSISAGQIVVDLGEEAEEDASTVVNLVLNNAEITCSVAPAILVLNAYECGDDSEENATPAVDTKAAGFNLILAKDSTNVINGAYVAKIFKDGTTMEDVEKDEAKKKYKFDGAVTSQVSLNVDSRENGKLTVNAGNEGISGSLHMTVNGGEIVINSHDDAINVNEDNVSVLTINGGIITCDSGLGKEGDGIDSNGYIVMNGGYVIAGGNGRSMDSGIDSDLGIFVNGGTLLASGNMYDEVIKDSEQLFAVFSFAETVKEDELIMITDKKDKPITAFSAANDYSIAVFSHPDLKEGTYHLYKVSGVTGDLNGSIYTNITNYKDAVQLQAGSSFVMGGPGMGGGGFEMPEGGMPWGEGEAPEMPENFEMPEGGFEMPEGGQFEMPEGFEMPESGQFEMPEGFEQFDGERPEGGRGGKGPGKGGDMPFAGGGRPEMFGGEAAEPTTEFELSKENYQFGSISVKK